MAASPEKLLQYFTAMDNQGGIVVKDAPKFDLETYIANYKGRTRFDRLLLIGQSSVALCVDALKAALAEAKKGRDTARYREAADLLRQASPREAEALVDAQWADATEKANREETRRLEQELKGYKNNLVRESIRMGNEDLGKHLEAIGDLLGAAEAYSRMRPDVTTSKQIVDVGKHLVNIALQKRDWATLIANLNKIAALQGQLSDDTGLDTYLRAINGVSLLGQAKFREAAESFLKADNQAPSGHYSEALSPNDVAVYGGLLSLATMGRKEIQARVLDNQNFRPFLELEPHIRRAITLFVNGRYSACLVILEGYRADYLLDLYLQKHVPYIYLQIRSKCISQYLNPFSCVTLACLNESFAIEGESIEDELVAMISNGTLNARIDTVDKMVITTTARPRAQMQAAAINTVLAYEREAAERLRRMNLMSADLEIRNQRRVLAGAPVASSMVTVTDDWYEETPPMAA
ncbi:CSN-1 [Gaeumannomyces tritici R3-111a-1]|uniref:COP9 signalosome complex subunit 1 n=1 Tax=Gaeumannomyces tritici (strain R3-111a-1) TaxID=644352 RepID=J3PJI7_GAET3|nr:CSN-1 [Gaeumannomyces tritici R3-111a-1]EJT68765.1 CSN-1 [Gaeumannomyces tritici R3-111a-1]